MKKRFPEHTDVLTLIHQDSHSVVCGCPGNSPDIFALVSLLTYNCCWTVQAPAPCQCVLGGEVSVLVLLLSS